MQTIYNSYIALEKSSNHIIQAHAFEPLTKELIQIILIQIRDAMYVINMNKYDDEKTYADFSDVSIDTMNANIKFILGNEPMRLDLIRQPYDFSIGVSFSAQENVMKYINKIKKLNQI